MPAAGSYSFTPHQGTSNLSAARLNSKPLYRAVSEGALNAIRETNLLRGGREGATYFTDSRFRSAATAQNRLSLPNTPEYMLEFRIANDPLIRGGTRVRPDFGGAGGGREYWTLEPISVEVINFQRLR